jgi:hypothetical protein
MLRFQVALVAFVVAPLLAAGQSTAPVHRFVQASPQRNTEYLRHTIFDNSITADSYFYSAGHVSGGSTLRLVSGNLPVDRQEFRTPPNALRLEWKSAPNGSWDAEIRVPDIRNRPPTFQGETLWFWLWSADALSANALPQIRLSDSLGGFSTPLQLGAFVGAIPAQRWVRLSIPLSRFRTGSIFPFDPHRLRSLTFVQGAADNSPHMLLVDEFWIGDARKVPGHQPALGAPQNVTATGYERHIDIAWDLERDERVQRYIIYRSLDGRDFRPIGMQLPGTPRFTDFVGKSGQRAFYKVASSNDSGALSPTSSIAEAITHEMSDDDLLTMLQEACFRYYWENADPASGATLESSPGDDRIVATGASGFGVMALIVGVERGFITRAQGAERLLKIVNFFERAPRYHGVWSHFNDGATAKTLPVFGMVDNGGDLVETAFLIQGLLAARQYFNGSTDKERTLMQKITQLWRDVEWDWYRETPQNEALYWHWSPEWGFRIHHRLTGFNETMIVYLLAIASPTHAVPASLYYSGWAGQSEAAVKYREGWSGTTDGDHYANGHEYFGIKLDVGSGRGGPLFFTHYSYMGFDPHALTDRYTNYFENNRNIAQINRAWCVANPGKHKGYGADEWGLTASDGPDGYMPHEPKDNMDDGTITPTGALASFPYTPDASLAALKDFYRDLGDRVWDVYGPRDAFNLDHNWFSPIYMGLNQAPITVMIENQRSGMVWKMFMANPEIAPMLNAISSAR